LLTAVASGIIDIEISFFEGLGGMVCGEGNQPGVKVAAVEVGRGRTAVFDRNCMPANDRLGRVAGI
jgi:hypothetical protein